MTTTVNEPPNPFVGKSHRRAYFLGYDAGRLAAERAIGAEALDEIPDHVVDRDGLVWRIVRDGGMATRADYEGITSIGINTLRDDHGPLHPVARLTRERNGQ